MSKLFGVIISGSDCKGIVYPMCKGIMVAGCKGVITGSGDFFGVMMGGCKGVIYPD